jgi:hypothetical protein
MVAQGQPPCHKSESGKSFSVHVDGGFFCFSCWAGGGDIIDYVALRDHLSKKEAAKKLGCYDEAPSPETIRRLAEQARERDRQRQLELTREAEQRRRRLELCDEIHAMVAIQRETSDRLSELERGAPEVYPDETEHCWSLLSLCLQELRMTETAYCMASGLPDPWSIHEELESSL